MKAFSILTLFVLLASFTLVKMEKHDKTIFISPKSKLEIVGDSNISAFKCVFNVKNLNKPLRIAYEEGKEIIRFQESTLILEASFFDCGGRGINRDFHDLLKTKEHPQILLTLMEIKKESMAEKKVEALVKIQIAGVSRTYKVNVHVNDKDNLHIGGKLKLNITDFNLVAPKKMMGLIVVSEEIEIIFNLYLEEPRKV